MAAASPFVETGANKPMSVTSASRMLPQALPTFPSSQPCLPWPLLATTEGSWTPLSQRSSSCLLTSRLSRTLEVILRT